jgi:phosphoenolpyruvate-protein kinase (PTS system EI component)
MAGEPMIAPVLLGLGIRELSMSAVSVPEVKATIRAMKIEDAQALVKRIDKLPTAAEVRAMVSEFVFGLTEQRRERKG